ncbi:TrmB family transcriptional regulator [bacterium]|nr:TrmB family transcriptional regulator [bacterium]
MDKIIESLKELGFNTYEAKVYVALLKKYPATGYEVSKLANIPQSRTYDTLKVLCQKQYVTSTPDKPVMYSPIKPTELTKRYKRKVTSNIEFLEKHLPNVKEDYMEPIISINGDSEVHSKLIEIIKNAQKEIYIEVWSQDFKRLEQELLNAYNRNVEIRIVGYDRLQSRFGMVFEHPFAKKLENYFKGRVVIIAVDDKEAFYGKIPTNPSDSSGGIWTKNADIVFLIKELMIHDMLLLDIQHGMTEELMYKYGNGFKRLYDKVLGVNNIYRS